MDTIVDRLERLYSEKPHHVAIHCITEEGVDHISIRSLLDGATGIAREIRKAGVRPGEAVIIILPHSRELIEVFFGSLLCGAVPSILPFLSEKLDPARYAQSLMALSEITRPAAIITDPVFVEEVHTAVRGNGRAVPVLVAKELYNERNQIFERLSDSSPSVDAVALLQHSSGTTGLQKGVALSHRSILSHIDNYAQAIDMNPEDVVVSWLPLYHDMGLIAGFVMPILLGATLVLMSPLAWVRAPYMLFLAVSRYKGTLTWLPNFAFNFCSLKIRDRDLEGVDLSSWRAVINCSEPMREESHRQFLERFRGHGLGENALATCYAMAENVFAITQSRIGTEINVDVIDRNKFKERHIAQPCDTEEKSIAFLSAGMPLVNTEIRVLDEAHNTLPERAVGEIALRSDCLLTEYYRRQDLTDQAFTAGWFLTGDLGYLADGELYVAGRKKEIIIVGGKNVYPQDLETIANEMPGIHPGRAVAFGIFNEELGTEDVAIVAEGENEPPEDRQQLVESLRRTINRSSDIAVRYVTIVPRGWVIKTSSGKLARDANREKFVDEFLNESANR